MRLFNAVDRSNLRPDLPTPLYHQLYVVIKRKIESGDLRQGTLLPAEKDIAAFFGISRITVKRALDDLEAEAYVSRQRGRGTHITYKYEPKVLRAPLNSMLDSLAAIGRDTQIRLIEFARVALAARSRRRAADRPDQKVDRAIRVRTSEGGRALHQLDDPGGRATHARVLNRLPRGPVSLGIHLTEVDQVITAIVADSTLACWCATATLLQVTRVSFDQRPADRLSDCGVPSGSLPISDEDVRIRCAGRGSTLIRRQHAACGSIGADQVTDPPRNLRGSHRRPRCRADRSPRFRRTRKAHRSIAAECRRCHGWAARKNCSRDRVIRACIERRGHCRLDRLGKPPP
jgi:GntR family transcriptional regulator